MSRLRSVLRRRLRLAAGATAIAIVMAVGVPAALASYISVYAPTQAIAPQPLLMPASFACTAPGNSSVSLTWSDADATTADPYGGFVISGYIVERSTDGGSTWSQLATPARTDTGVSDANFGLLAVGSHINYRMRSTKSTNWVSTNTATLTATVTVIVVVKSVTCP